MTDDRERRQMRRGEQAIHALGRHHGNAKEAAFDQDVTVKTLKRRIAEYCDLMGFDTAFEAAYRINPDTDIGQIGLNGL